MAAIHDAHDAILTASELYRSATRETNWVRAASKNALAALKFAESRLLSAERELDAAETWEMATNFDRDRRRRYRAQMDLNVERCQCNNARHTYEDSRRVADAVDAKCKAARKALNDRVANHQDALDDHGKLTDAIRRQLVNPQVLVPPGHGRAVVSSWLSCLCEDRAARLRDSAVVALHGVDASRYAEEWQSDMEQFPAGWPRFRWALSLRLRAPRQIRKNAAARTPSAAPPSEG